MPSSIAPLASASDSATVLEHHDGPESDARVGTEVEKSQSVHSKFSALAKPGTEGMVLGVDGHLYPRMSTLQAIMLTASMTLAMLLNIMNVQAVTIALRSIGVELNMRVSNYQWLVSSYSLAFGSLLLLFGRLADIYGHKLVFLCGIAWFGIWSIGVGFAPTEIGMDIMRALQGAGAGASIPAALGILGSSFPPSQAKSTAFATFSAGAPLGASIGAVLGGVLTEYAPAGWRAIFFVSAGIAAIIFSSAWYFVPPDREVEIENRSVDWIGAALITSGLVLLTFTLAAGDGSPQGWKTPYIPVLFVLGILLIAAFWFYEQHLEYKTSQIPLMRTSLWFKGRFAAVQLIAALGWSAFSSYMFFATLLYQNYKLLPPILTTVRFLPASVSGLILNIIVAIVASRVPAQYLFILGGLGTALAPLLFAVQDINAMYWEYEFPGMILSVFGADFIFSAGIMYVSKVAGPGQQALAGGVFNMVTQVGTSVGLAIMTIIQSRVTAKEVERLGGVYDPDSEMVVPEAILKGIIAAFWGCVGFAFAATIVAVTCLYGIGKVGHRIKKVLDEEVSQAKV